MEEELLRLEGLSKYYASAQTVVMGLNQLSLSFRRGEFVAVTGESGSGKSTLAHVLGGTYHLPHGRLCAMVLPHVMSVNATVSLAQYARFAKLAGLSAPTERLSLRNLLSAMERLRTALGLPGTLKQAGVEPTGLMNLIPAVLADGCCKTNPVPVTEAMVEEVLRAVSR